MSQGNSTGSLPGSERSGFNTSGASLVDLLKPLAILMFEKLEQVKFPPKPWEAFSNSFARPSFFSSYLSPYSPRRGSCWRFP